jgi:hypothetical protein
VTCTSCPPGYACNSSGVCAGGDAGGIVLNVPTVTISGRVTLNGAVPVVSPFCFQTEGAVRLTFTETTRRYTFAVIIDCNTTDFSFSAALYPGTYEVRVANIGNNSVLGSNLPSTQQTAALVDGVGFLAARALPLTTSLSGQIFDVTTASYSGQVTLNGALPVADPACNQAGGEAQVTLIDRADNYEFQTIIPCDDAGFSFGATVYPGTYDVSVGNYTYLQSQGSNLPVSMLDVNTPQTVAYVAATGLPIAGTLAGQVLDVKTASVSGTITSNGAAPSVSFFCSNAGAAAHVTFTDSLHGYTFNTFVPCTTTNFAYSATLFPGTYAIDVGNVVNGQSGGSTSLPVGNDELGNLMVSDYHAASLSVAGPITGQQLNVVSYSVSGKLTLNGATPVIDSSSTGCLQVGNGNAALVTLTDAVNGYRFSRTVHCNQSLFPFNVQAYPGTYRVEVGNATSGTAKGSNLPVTQLGSGNVGGVGFVAVPSLALNATLSNQTLDVRTARVAGTVTLNGVLPIVGAQCGQGAALVTFHEQTHGYSFSTYVPCTTTDFSFSAIVYPGTYEARVSNLLNQTFMGSNLPYTQGPLSNWSGVDYQALSSFPLAGGADAGVVLDVPTVTVGGWVTLDGAVPMASMFCGQTSGSAAVDFTETTHGYDFNTFIDCATSSFAWSEVIYPGTYRVRVANTGNSSVQGSNLPVTGAGTIELDGVPYVAIGQIQVP